MSIPGGSRGRASKIAASLRRMSSFAGMGEQKWPGGTHRSLLHCVSSDCKSTTCRRRRSGSASIVRRYGSRLTRDVRNWGTQYLRGHYTGDGGGLPLAILRTAALTPARGVDRRVTLQENSKQYQSPMGSCAYAD